VTPFTTTSASFTKCCVQMISYSICENGGVGGASSCCSPMRMCMLQPGWYGVLLSDINVAIQTGWQHVRSRQAILDRISLRPYREPVFFSCSVNSMRIFRIPHMAVPTVANTLLVLALVFEHTARAWSTVVPGCSAAKYHWQKATPGPTGQAYCPYLS